MLNIDKQLFELRSLKVIFFTVMSVIYSTIAFALTFETTWNQFNSLRDKVYDIPGLINYFLSAMFVLVTIFGMLGTIALVTALVMTYFFGKLLYYVGIEK